MKQNWSRTQLPAAYRLVYTVLKITELIINPAETTISTTPPNQTSKIYSKEHNSGITEWLENRAKRQLNTARRVVYNKIRVRSENNIRVD